MDVPGMDAGRKITDLIHHAVPQERLFLVMPLALAGAGSADGKIEAQVAALRRLGPGEDEAHLPGEIGHGRGPVAVDVPGADVGVTVAKNVKAVVGRGARREGAQAGPEGNNPSQQRRHGEERQVRPNLMDCQG
jgi:hypothetical protein